MTMSQRALPDDAERSDNKRARVDHQLPHDQLQSINQSHHECDLVRYSFLLPLVLTFLNDRTVLGRLLHVCKAMKKRMIGYMLKKPMKPDIAYDLMRDSRYLPVIITHLTKVSGEDLSAFANLTSVHYDYSYDGAIQLPDTVTDFTMPVMWNSPLTRDMFPGQLKRFRFGEYFKQAIEPGVLPSSLTELCLRCIWPSYNHPLLPGVFPLGLVKLTLPYSSNHEIVAGVLPETLQWLRTSIRTSCHLPQSLRHLELINQGVLDSSFLPNALTHLSLGSSCKLSGPLPSSVVNLTARLRADIDGLNRSTTITHLHMDCSGEEDEESEEDKSDEGEDNDEEQKTVRLNTCQIPASVMHLRLSNCYLKIKPGFVPRFVTHLSFRSCRPVLQPGSIPDSVIDLHLYSDVALLQAGVIPSSVKTLYLGQIAQPLHVGVIPSSVETLILGKWLNHALPHGVIPSSVTRLVCLHPFKEHVPSIPNSVVDLQCCWPEDVLVPVGVIPDSVKKLKFGGADPSDPDRDIGPKSQLLVVGSIPASVTELDMGPYYNAPIAAGIIPAAIQVLKLGRRFKSTLPPEWTDNPACYLSDESTKIHRW